MLHRSKQAGEWARSGESCRSTSPKTGPWGRSLAMSKQRPSRRLRGSWRSCRWARVPLKDVRCVTWWAAWADTDALTGETLPCGDRGCVRGCAQALLRRSAVRRAGGGVPPVYRRSIGTASCTQDEFVAEIEAVGVVCHIGTSNQIPGLIPRSWGSRSYEMGKVEHGGL